VIVKWVQIYFTRRVKAVERGVAKVGGGDVDEFHFLDCMWFFMGDEGTGVRGES